MRTLVSFEADFPTDGNPPGEELADYVAAALRSAGFEIDGPTEREGWAWDLTSRVADVLAESIVGFSDDPPLQWQIHTYGHLPLLKRFSSAAKEQRDELIRRWTNAIHDALSTDPRFRSIRWYEQDQFDRDHGETYFHSPS